MSTDTDGVLAAPPVTDAGRFEAQERDRRARDVRRSLNIGLSSCVLVLVVTLLGGGRLAIVLCFVGAAALSMPYLLLFAGRIREAALVSAIIPLGLVTYHAATNAGLADVAAAGFPVVVMYSAMTLSRRSFVWFMGLVSASVAFVGLNTYLRWLPINPNLARTWIDSALFVALVIITAVVAWMLAENVRDGLWTANVEIERRRAVEAELAALTSTDSLTGVSSRRVFDEQLARLSQSRRHPLSVIIADVDGLKDVNDTLGHAAGDEVLVRAAATLKACVRADDILARIGGDEFAVLLPETNEAGAQDVVRRVEELLRASTGTRGPDVRLSLGCASASATEAVATFKLADARMYVNKAARKATPAAPQDLAR